MTSRRQTIIGLGGLLAGGGALVSTGAFDTVEAERSVGVETAGDASAFLGLDPAPDQDVAGFGSNDLIEFDLGEIPVGSRVTHSELVHATNQGTQTVTSLKFEFLVDSSDIINGDGDHQDDEDVAEALRIVSENDEGVIVEIDAKDDENLIAKSDAGDAGNNELAPGEYIPFGIRVDLPDAPIDEISGAQDITLRIIAESGEVEDDDPGDGPVLEPNFVFTADGPKAVGEQGPPNTVEFTVENQGTAVTLSSFRVDISGEGEQPDTFDEYEITTPQGTTIDGFGGFDVNEPTEHDEYEIGLNETASYELREFDTNNMNGILNNEAVTFDIVLIDEGGSEHVVSG